jgi:hypothetical protein
MLDTISFEACGKRYELRPDFKALIAIERETGRRFLAMAMEMQANEVGAQDIQSILNHGLKSGSGAVDQKELEAIVNDLGFAAVGSICASFMVSALAGPKKPEAPADQ